MKRLFYLIVAIQMLFLVGQVVFTEVSLHTGRVITLKVAPVDPRSLLMGNYIDLSYDISTIDLSRVRIEQPQPRFEHGETVYAVLRPGKPYAEIVGVTLERPSATADNLVYLKGRITDRFDHALVVDYGLDRYYIPEDKEDEVDRMAWSARGRIGVEVAVTGSGRGIIRRILVDGKPIGF